MSKFPSHVPICNFSLFPSLGLIRALKHRAGKRGGNLLLTSFHLLPLCMAAFSPYGCFQLRKAVRDKGAKSYFNLAGAVCTSFLAVQSSCLLQHGGCPNKSYSFMCPLCLEIWSNVILDVAMKDFRG